MVKVLVIVRTRDRYCWKLYFIREINFSNGSIRSINSKS
jgi:hypothetical protein